MNSMNEMAERLGEVRNSVAASQLCPSGHIIQCKRVLSFVQILLTQNFFYIRNDMRHCVSG